MTFKDLGLNKLEFEGRGERIAKEFYIPVLRESVLYDRATGYFSVDALVHAASGVAGLINNGGKMRLILGAHDVPEELWEAYKMGMISGREVIEEIGKRIAQGLEKIEDIFARKRLEVLAWMFNKGMLEVKVVLPRHIYMGQHGIFHIKTMIFRDKEGSIIAAEGSANETEPAYTVNGERIVVFYSWRAEDRERIESLVRLFNTIWSAEHPDYDVFNLPEAVYRVVAKLTPKSPAQPELASPKRGDLADRLLPACRMVRILPRVRCLAHMGLGPVRLFPHQARAVDLAMERYPFRILFADEVGLGKTIEAGACIKLLWSLGYVRRVLVLAPKNVTRQWWEELRLKFGLPAYLLKPGKPCSVVAPDGKEFPAYENPFDFADLIVGSWHYVRGRRGSEPDVFRARPFDLVLIDEAHAARITRSEFSSPRPTRLHELATALSTMTPHVFLLTATPLQLNPLEILDLMKILGLGGAWVHEDSFMKCYEILKKDPEARDESEWVYLFSLVAWFSRTYLQPEHREAVVKGFLNGDLAWEVTDLLAKGDDDGFRRLLRRTDVNAKRSLDGILRGLMPTSWFIVRNTRERLKREGYKFPERQVENIDVLLDAKHSEILEGLEDYLAHYYNAYKQALTGNRWAGFGLISSVYYQRFVSSFASAYWTVRRRKEFLEGLLEGDEERMLELASDLLEGSEEEIDEDELIDSVKESLEKVRPLVEEEINELGRLSLELAPYSRASSASDDPKLREIRRVVEQLRGTGRKVLVFSKFTDTVEIVRDFLSLRIGRDRVGTYTGKGGELWDPEKGVWAICPKDQVSRALEGTVDVLVCSDAASEGLNLQAASAVVNVDMPWNPAKVEQRIGRVDRIGQASSEVKIVNVWYPDTYEAKMYKALFERQHIWWVIVGPTSGIISESLARAFEEGLKGEELQRRIRETVDKVEASKDEAIRLARTFTEEIPLKPTIAETEVANVLERFVRMACKAIGITARRRGETLWIEEIERLPLGVQIFAKDGLYLAPGKPGALVPGHPFVQWLASEVQTRAGMPDKIPYSVYGVGGKDGMLDVYVLEPEGKPRRLEGAEGVIRLLEALLDLAEAGLQ